MSYNYEEEKKVIFTDQGQRTFLAIRDATHALMAKAGAARMDAIIRESNVAGDSWLLLACVDRLRELGEIEEVVTFPVSPTQYRIFRKKRLP